MPSISSHTRVLLREGAFTAVAFFGLGLLYLALIWWSVKDVFAPGPLRTYLESGAVYVELGLGGLFIGGTVGVINRWAESPRLRRRSPLAAVLARAGLHLLTVIATMAVVIAVIGAVWSPELVAGAFRALTPRFAVSLVFWLGGSIVLINLMLEVGRLLGPGRLVALLLGRYARPRQERRVFLFMDLQDSTATAEALGHERYSAFIQECYRDLTPTLMGTGASVYQYVGDEVVLSWPADRGRSPTAAIAAFFGFRGALEARAPWYRDRFGVEPRFRGGADVGEVTVCEVGDVKREIAYHGDVLNTASRLLDLCKIRDAELVVSARLGPASGELDEVRTRWREPVSLKGKADHVEALALDAE